MKINLTVRGLAPLFTTICFLAVLAPAYGGGNKDQPKAIPQTPEWSLVGIEPSEKPEWVTVVPKSDTDIYFVGTSQMYDTPANARDNARENARTQVLEYYGQVIEKQAVSLSSVSGSTRDTLASYVVREDEIKSFAQNVVSEVATVAYVTETYINSKTNKSAYVVYTLHKINRQKAESEIADFAKNISTRYTASIPQWGTLKAALEGYALIVKSLEQNPLYRIMAFYETPNGKAGLYEYAKLQISELSNSVSIASIPNQIVSKTDNLDTVVKLHSAQIPSLGPFNCRVSVQGMNTKIPVVNYTVNNDNAFLLINKTNLLAPGTYNVQIELLMNEVTTGMAKNTSGGFSFEVTPLNAVLNSRDTVEAGIKKAVDTLATRIPTATETVIGVFTLTGANAPSELSLFLTEKVSHYATENQARKYKIVEGESENRAVLFGFFTRRDNLVDVTLKLTSPDKTALGSQIFSISLAWLEQIPIAVEPVNIAILPEREKIIDTVINDQTNKGINIQAFFNNESRTYFHREQLNVTVMADKDCFFKVIHIDANNQVKMIYPNSNDKNNYLRANMPRALFETASSYIYGPYGAETLLIVASTKQFEKIEDEYIKPLLPATGDSVSAAVKNGRGTDLEPRTTPLSQAFEGEARYTITVLKPHEEYMYGKPSDMEKTVQTMQDDALRQGGSFVGNETSGYSVVNNVRVSYRIPRNAPDMIEFAYYNLDNFSGVRSARGQSRGEGFDFYIDKPANITQTIQVVRSGIESKGGIFNGNEQQGNFKVKGIVGQYNVHEKVIVTITDKPVLIPNSLIEREVKNYFGAFNAPR